MSIFDRFKEIFGNSIPKGNPPETDNPNPPRVPVEEPTPASPQVPEPEPEPVPKPSSEQKMETESPVAEEQPRQEPEPQSPVKEVQSHPAAVVEKPKENYIETKHEALEIVCDHLSPYSYSNNKNLAVLRLLVAAPADDTQIEWADQAFEEELKIRLHQERIDAVKEVMVETLPFEQIREIMADDGNIKPMAERRLYYSLGPKKVVSATKKISVPTGPIWLVCEVGEEYLESPVIAINPEKKNLWNIGRGRNDMPGQVCNDIVIKDSCRDISRQQATLLNIDGKYYLQCRRGGCRRLGGKVTKVIRADNQAEELMTLSPKAVSPLNEGDTLQLSKSVFLRVTFTDPNP